MWPLTGTEDRSERTPNPVRAAIALAIFSAGLGVGYLLKSSIPPKPLDVEIRAGRRGFTNPLLDCEVGSYRPGRELRSFEDELGRRVAQVLERKTAASVALYFRDLDNGPWYGVHENEPFTPASLLKVPTIMACLKQAERDPAFLRRQIRYEGLPEKEGIGDFTAEVPLEKGRTYTVEELIVQVAAYSDNYAVALLDTVVDREILRRLFSYLGLDAELVTNPLKRADISPKEYGDLFRVLYNASYLNQEMSERALTYFTLSSYRDGLVAGAPPGTVVAHKFGVLTETVAGQDVVQLHDCGIVYQPERPYFLCIMTRGSDEAALAGVIQSLSAFVHEQVVRTPEEVTGGELP
jgi:beta-lactamase class A